MGGAASSLGKSPGTARAGTTEPAWVRWTLLTLALGFMFLFLVLPLAALREGDAVWVVDDARLQSRPVRLGMRTLQSVEVLQSLSAGEQVALGYAAQPGKRVRLQAIPR